jgi:hypothetical protein
LAGKQGRGRKMIKDGEGMFPKCFGKYKKDLQMCISCGLESCIHLTNAAGPDGVKRLADCVAVCKCCKCTGILPREYVPGEIWKCYVCGAVWMMPLSVEFGELLLTMIKKPTDPGYCEYCEPVCTENDDGVKSLSAAIVESFSKEGYLIHPKALLALIAAPELIPSVFKDLDSSVLVILPEHVDRVLLKVRS